jgi:hypothetical protein
MGLTTYAGSLPSTIKKNKTFTLYGSVKTATVTATVYSPSTNYNIGTMRIKYNNGLYYFITTNGFVHYSSDAKTWNVSSRAGTATTMRDVHYNGTIWVAIGSNASNTLFSSTDLTTWTSRTSNISGTGIMYQIEWIPAFSRFIIVGDGNAAPWNCVSSSTDGITWTSAAVVPTAGASSSVWGMAYDGSGTVVISANNATNNGYYTTNGTAWTVTNMNNSSASSYIPMWIGGNVNRFVGANGYSQTAAGLATAWSTAPYTDYYAPMSQHYGLQNSPTYGSASQLIPNTTDNVLYAYQPYNNSSGNAAFPELRTLDMANPVLSQFVTGSYNSYTLPTLHQEPLPTLAQDRQSFMNTNYSALGWGNGIIVYAGYIFNTLNIWSTAV